LKILLSFLQDTGQQPHNIPAYRFWTYYIKNGIEEAGMHWTEIPGLDWAAGLVPYEGDPELEAWKQRAWETTITYIKANQKDIDVFLCYLYPKQINTDAIKQIKQLGIPCVNFYCDHIRSFAKLPPEFNVFDLIWVPEYEALSMYKNAGVNHINLPMPMWVHPQYRVYPQNKNKDILFIGSKDSLRAELLAEVIQKGLPVTIRGTGWDAPITTADAVQNNSFGNKLKNQAKLIRNRGVSGFIAYHTNSYKKETATQIPPQNILAKPGFDEYIALSRESGITLGINRVEVYNRLTKSLTTYSRLRDIEAPMLGACYLTEYTEGLAHLYELGTEIETYRSAQELADKCRELLSNESRQKEMRVKAQQKALSQHTIPVSLQQIKTRLFK
jgi:hypothetical protein